MALASGLLAGTSFWAPLLGVALLLWCLWKIIYPFTIQKQESDERPPGRLRSFLLFIYGSFIKPHTGDDEGYKQQAALESFYKSQASVYDATRKKLLCGREDMLGIVAAQLLHRERNGSSTSTERIWVDVSIVLLHCTHAS
jgi:betaine lipid synthase